MQNFSKNNVDPLKDMETADFEARDDGYDKINESSTVTEKTALRLQGDIEYSIEGSSETTTDPTDPRVEKSEAGVPKVASATLGRDVTPKTLQNEFDMEDQNIKSIKTNLVGKEDLYTISACLRRCSLFIGNDSGLMHMAAAANIPTLGLFGPSRVENYHPWGKYTEAVCTEKSYHELVKKPVKRADNSYNMMDSLTVDSVVEAVENLLFKHKIITI